MGGRGVGRLHKVADHGAKEESSIAILTLPDIYLTSIVSCRGILQELNYTRILETHVCSIQPCLFVAPRNGHRIDPGPDHVVETQTQVAMSSAHTRAVYGAAEIT